ncbi:patatin-like phospholipase family protein [Sulfuriflexus mobilis]|uniref:patatin-like phospholipase family protein n=1 Tax=Sulfuriflexus mobilis TaxID=1811807 RepID=UPI000F84AA64|nr:patatin-like phospholipase family protein [Sulfuriflexus mobilis]
MEYLSRYLTLLIFLGLISGCGTLPRNPVPLDQMQRAEITGLTGIRAWSGTASEQFEKDLLLSVQQALKHASASESVAVPVTDILSLSSGSDYGAFGAGFMYGWSQSGLRPKFKLVTGVSTGALIAPFAFLGPGYDNVLKQAYTTISAKDIYAPRWFSFLWNDAFADSAPLEMLINRYITKDVLHAIAQAHRQGRRLYIGTTNLDADQLVVWNMGVIANSRDPKALELFRKIIFASSSIPGVFPPVLIDVDIDGVPYDEMHVDGGIKAQLFLLAATLNLTEFRKKSGVFINADRKSRIFVIRNGLIISKPKQVPRNLSEISGRAMASLIKTQALNDLNRVYELAKEQGLEFNWVALPAEYELAANEKFNTEKMKGLFEIGYEMGLKGDAWYGVPPGLSRP